VSVNEKRIAALRRMLLEHDAGLDPGTTKDDFARVIDELLDEVELLRALFIKQHFGDLESPEREAMIETFEEVF
jgi:hypothetical protein